MASVLPRLAARAAMSAEENEELAFSMIRGNLQANIGPVLMGFALDVILMGTMVHQVVLFCSNLSCERRLNKILVAWVVVIASATTLLGFYWVYYLFVLHYGRFAPFIETDKLAAFASLDVCVTGPIQVFYLERAYRLMRNRKWVLWTTIPMIGISVAGGFASSIHCGSLASVKQLPQIRPTLFIWVGSTLIGDLLLTGCIAYGLIHAKSGWSGTDRLINRLIRMAIETQLPGTLVSIAFMLSYGIKTESLLCMLWELVKPKICVVSLLAIINHRYYIRRALSSTPEDQTYKNGTTFGMKSLRTQQRTMIDLDQIHVETQVHKESHEVLPFHVGVNRRPASDGMGDEAEEVESFEINLGDSNGSQRSEGGAASRQPFQET